MKWLFSSVFGIAGLIFVMVGCPFLAVAAGFYYFVDYRSADWVVVSAQVTGLSQSKSTDSDGITSTTYCPYLAFTTDAGEQIEVNSNDCSTPAAYKTGDTVEIKYNPANPREVQIRGGTLETLTVVFGWVFGGLGALLLLGGVGLGVVGIVVALRRR